MARHDIATGKQPNRMMRDHWVARAVAERPEWEQVTWWQTRREALPARECKRNALHGAARTYVHVSHLGKVMGYCCVVCGWDLPVLVQDGPAEPTTPSTEVKLSNHQLAALSKTPEALRAGARVRAENVAKHGVKRPRKWWEDADDE
jgi:hypothetical protein